MIKVKLLETLSHFISSYFTLKIEAIFLIVALEEFGPKNYHLNRETLHGSLQRTVCKLNVRSQLFLPPSNRNRTVIWVDLKLVLTGLGCEQNSIIFFFFEEYYQEYGN